MSAPYLQSCYYVDENPLLVDEAKSACQNMHVKSRLVSIETNTEHDFLRHYLEKLTLEGGKLFIALIY